MHALDRNTHKPVPIQAGQLATAEVIYTLTPHQIISITCTVTIN